MIKNHIKSRLSLCSLPCFIILPDCNRRIFQHHGESILGNAINETVERISKKGLIRVKKMAGEAHNSELFNILGNNTIYLDNKAHCR